MERRGCVIGVALAWVVGCGTDDEGPSTGAGSTAASTGIEPTTSATGSVSSDPGSSTSNGGTDAGSGSTSTGGDAAPTPPECTAYCQTRASCDEATTQRQCEATCAQSWLDFGELFGDACLVDHAALLSCLAALACPDLAEFDDKHGQINEPMYPCMAQDRDQLISCQ